MLGLALAAGSCVDSGNHGWDFGHWTPPLVAEEQVEAYRGVHEGRIGLRCVRGGEPSIFIETWRPLAGAATPALLAQLGQASRMEALLPVRSGGVYPVTFNVSDFPAAHEWVRNECGQL